MPRAVNDQEFKSVSSLPAAKRYDHFVRQVADTQEVWSLRSNSGWAMLGDSEERKYFPIWPHARYAEAFATDGFVDHQPALISLNDWLARWLPGLVSDGVSVSVFPVPPGRGVPVTPERLRADLERELQNYE